MNPVMPCPRCGRDTNFHDDEVPEVEEGMAFCPDCGMELVEAAMIHEIVSGKHPDLVDAILEEHERKKREDAEEADDE